MQTLELMTFFVHSQVLVSNFECKLLFWCNLEENFKRFLFLHLKIISLHYSRTDGATNFELVFSSNLLSFVKLAHLLTFNHKIN